MTEINQFNLSPALLNKYKNLLYYNSYWHQIEVENVEGLDRDAVLKTLMKFCHPLHFIPVHYKAEKNTASFLLKNCGPAIQKMCTQNLVILNPFDQSKPFKLKIILCFASSNDLRINIQLNLMDILNKRFNQETGVLNLENFAKDPELEEYCALSQPKLFFYILHLAKDFAIKSLKLGYNDINSLKSIEALEGIRNPITMDLRYNNIAEIGELANISFLRITELWLDGNPVCDHYNEITYGKVVKDHLPKLEKLDGISVHIKGFLPFRRNYLCNLTGYDLVDQFLEHYFTLFDAQNRTVLGEVYHNDAFFSITSTFIRDQITSGTAVLTSYKKVSRNLKTLSDYSRTTQCLFRGPFQIIKILSSLPITEHDPYSFTADLVMYTETAAVLVVSGVFRECSEALLEADRLLGFTRTFVLLAGHNGEYSIINEMLTVTNATTSQATRAFKQVKLPKPKFIYIPHPQNERERSDMAEALQVVTGMRTDWAHKCLEECKYDMKDALTLFIDLYKKDKIPQTAFLSEQEKRELLLKKPRPTPTTQPKSRFSSSSWENPYTNKPLTESVNTSIPIKPYVRVIRSNTEKPVGQSIKTIQTLGKSSDDIWDDLPTTTKRGKVTECIPEIIDLANSPEELDLSGTSKAVQERRQNVGDKSITNKVADRKPVEVKRAASPDTTRDTKRRQSDNFSTSQVTEKKGVEIKRVHSPDTTPDSIASKATRKDQMNAFNTEFEAMKDIYKKMGHAAASQEAIKILSANCLEYECFEQILLWYYKTSSTGARELKNKLLRTANASTNKYLSPTQLEIAIAKCEYLYGGEAIGENIFKKLITARSLWARPVTEFCRVALMKNNVNKAKEILAPYNESHQLGAKMKRIATMLATEFKVKLT